MLLQNGKYLCVRCGAELDVTEDERPHVMIRASSGEPNLRVIVLDGREIHACPIGTAWEKRDRR